LHPAPCPLNPVERASPICAESRESRYQDAVRASVTTTSAAGAGSATGSAVAGFAGRSRQFTSGASSRCEKAVETYFTGAPNYWSKAEIKANVLDLSAPAATQFTKFDPASIMIYPIDAALTLDGTSFVSPAKLSATDIAFIRQQYPR
jgi:hypothetical protein